MAELRHLLSNETYLDQIGDDFHSSNLVIDSLLGLNDEVKKTNKADAIFEFTWLMINVAYLSSTQQLQQLKPILVYFVHIYNMQPDHIL